MDTAASIGITTYQFFVIVYWFLLLCIDIGLGDRNILRFSHTDDGIEFDCFVGPVVFDPAKDEIEL